MWYIFNKIIRRLIKKIYKVKYMQNEVNNKESTDIVKVKEFLDNLGFKCSSCPSAQNLIYSKNGDIITIKNKIQKGDGN